MLWQTDICPSVHHTTEVWDWIIQKNSEINIEISQWSWPLWSNYQPESRYIVQVSSSPGLNAAVTLLTWQRGCGSKAAAADLTFCSLKHGQCWQKLPPVSVQTSLISRLSSQTHNSRSARTLTLMVSSGCPAKTRQTPPNPPAKKFFSGLIGCGCLDIFTSGPAERKAENKTQESCEWANRRKDAGDRLKRTFKMKTDDKEFKTNKSAITNLSGYSGEMTRCSSCTTFNPLFRPEPFHGGTRSVWELCPGETFRMGPERITWTKNSFKIRNQKHNRAFNTLFTSYSTLNINRGC